LTSNPVFAIVCLCNDKAYLLRVTPKMLETERSTSTITSDSPQTEECIYNTIEKDVNTIPVGSDGVHFHPYLFAGGERRPFVKPSARASFTGLTLTHTLSHMLRAVYEGVALAMLDCCSGMPVDAGAIRLSGGGANSEVWCQVIADCLAKPVLLPSGPELGAKGAAMNVGIALNVYRNAQDAVARAITISHQFKPNAATPVFINKFMNCISSPMNARW
jgi:sugar (pentulose or hexulose) kinase